MATTSPPSIRKAGVLTGLFLVAPMTLSVMAVVLLAPILPQLQHAFENAPEANFLVPMILTTPALCIAIFSWPAGALGDKYGRRRLLMGALVLYAIVGIAPAFLNSLWAILATRVAVGMTEAMITTCGTAMVGDMFTGQSRDRWLGSQTAVAALSALVLFNVGGFLGVYGWRAPFLVYASSLLMLIGVKAFTWETPTRIQTRSTEIREHRTLFPWGPMLGIAAVTVFGSAMFFVVQIEASVGLTLHGITDPRRIGFLTSLASLAVPLGTVIFQFSTRVRIPTLLAIEFALLAAGFIAMKWAVDAHQFLFAATVNQLGAGMILPTQMVWAMRQLPPQARARGMGIYMSAFFVGQFLSPMAVTLIAMRTGGLFNSFEVLGYLCLAAALINGVVRAGYRNHPATVSCRSDGRKA